MTTITIHTNSRTTTSRPATRTRSDDVKALPAAIRSEWIKLASLRANKAIVGLTAVVTAGVAGALARSTDHHTLSASVLFIYPLPLVAALALVTGILMFTSEAQHGTLATTLAARPTRWVIAAAKTVMATAVGLAMGVTAMVAGFGGAVLGGAQVGHGAPVSRALWALLYITLATVIGLGVGMIVRHSAGAISGLLMWSFVVEGLLAPVLPKALVHFVPFSAGYRLLDAGSDFKPPVMIAHVLPRPAYALIFGGYALASVVIGTALLYRRDTS